MGGRPAGWVRGMREGGLGERVGELGLGSVPGTIRRGRVRACVCVHTRACGCSCSVTHASLSLGLSPVRHLCHLWTHPLPVTLPAPCPLTSAHAPDVCKGFTGVAPQPLNISCENRVTAARPHSTGALVLSHAQHESTAAALSLGCASRAGRGGVLLTQSPAGVELHVLVSSAVFSPCGTSPSLDAFLSLWHREVGTLMCRGQLTTTERTA